MQLTSANVIAQAGILGASGDLTITPAIETKLNAIAGTISDIAGSWPWSMYADGGGDFSVSLFSPNSREVQVTVSPSKANVVILKTIRGFRKRGQGAPGIGSIRDWLTGA